MHLAEFYRLLPVSTNIWDTFSSAVLTLCLFFYSRLLDCVFGLFASRCFLVFFGLWPVPLDLSLGHLEIQDCLLGYILAPLGFTDSRTVCWTSLDLCIWYDRWGGLRSGDSGGGGQVGGAQVGGLRSGVSGGGNQVGALRWGGSVDLILLLNPETRVCVPTPVTV